MSIPRVSVLMSVYNGARYLAEAIDSILGQTFADFEFIIIDDGSTDATNDILRTYSDARICVLHNPKNLGLTRSLNHGLSVAQGEYVARMDADDISLPERLQKQVSFLDAHPMTAMVGSAYYQIDANGSLIGTATLPCDYQDIKEQLLYRCCFCHGATMFRRNAVRQVGNYREEFYAAQDWDLWVRLNEDYQLANLPDILYKLRIGTHSISVQKRNIQRRAAQSISESAMKRRMRDNRCDSISPLTMGRYHWHQALWALAEGNTARVISELQMAWNANPLLQNDSSYLISQLVDLIYDPRLVDEANVGVQENRIAQSHQMIDQFFALMPEEVCFPSPLRRRVLGELHAAYAFASYRNRRGQQTRFHAIRALWYDLTGKHFNRGLVSVLIRSFGLRTPDMQAFKA